MKAVITFMDKNNCHRLDETQKVVVDEEVVIGIEGVMADHMTPALVMAQKVFVSIKETIESVAKEKA